MIFIIFGAQYKVEILVSVGIFKSLYGEEPYECIKCRLWWVGIFKSLYGKKLHRYASCSITK